MYAIDGKLVNPKVSFGWYDNTSIYVQLNSDDDPHGKCVASFTIKWRPTFADGQYGPKIFLEGEDIKFLALYPDILNIFLNMDHGRLSSSQVLAGLVKIGERKDLERVDRGMDEIENERIERELDALMQEISSETV